jgi:hypothetical protein
MFLMLLDTLHYCLILHVVCVLREAVVLLIGGAHRPWRLRDALSRADDGFSEKLWRACLNLGVILSIHVRSSNFDNHNTSTIMASGARDIVVNGQALGRQVSNSLGLSISPTTTFGTPPQHASSPHGSSFGGAYRRSTTDHSTVRASAKQLKPFATEDIKILLLENVNKTGRDALEKQGYQVEFHKASLPEEELIAKIR